MPEYILHITPHDPLIARDGRPFGLGTRMKSLDWLYPSVVAGSLRTMLGKLNGGDFTKEKIEALKSIEVTGVFPVKGNVLFFPAPKDLLIYKEDKTKDRKLMPLRPLKEISKGSGTDLPEELVPIKITDDVKPETVPAFWPENQMIEWLTNPSGDRFPIPPEKSDVFLHSIEKEERTHVKIKPETGAAEDTQLFATTGLRLPEGIDLTARVRTENSPYDCLLKKLNDLHPLGGERRLASWKNERPSDWEIPESLLTSIDKSNHLRMVLATPAIFDCGWKPDWLDDNLTRCQPGMSGVKLKLVSAIVDRWKPISGWDYEKRGPKAIRRLVPAGSVFFFEVDKGNTKEVAEKLWLESVCDQEQDRRDGFGLALWGTWDYAQDKQEAHQA